MASSRKMEGREGKKKKKVNFKKVKWWKMCKELLLFLIAGQNWQSVSAAAEGPQRRTGVGDQDAAGNTGKETDERRRFHKGRGSQMRKTEMK